MASPQQPVRTPLKERAARVAVESACEFTTTQEHLSDALRSVSGVAGRNPTLPILHHVLLKREKNHLRFSTTDLEVGVTAWLPGKLHGDGALTAPLRPLLEYAQNLPPGPVTLHLQPGSLAVTAQSAHAVFQGESAENFPLIPHLEGGDTVTLPLPLARTALDGVLYAMAADDTRPELASVFLKADSSVLTLAATDSYRLAEAHLQLTTPPKDALSVILPNRAAQEIRRALEGVEEAVLHIGENQVLLKTASVHVVSRRMEGVYPDYTQIIPQQSPTTVEVDRVSLLRALRASAVFGGTTVSRVTLGVGKESLRVAATTPEMGSTETDLPAVVTGPTVAISFNTRFLREALSALAGECVVIGLGSPSTPGVFRPLPEGDVTKHGTEAPTHHLATLALVMPIKT